MRVPLPVLVVSLSLASACPKSAPAPPDDDVTGAVPVSAPPPPAAVTDVVMANDPFVRPRPAGETFTLQQGEFQRAAGGLEVKYASHGHKQPAGPGRFLQMIRLELSRGGQVQHTELRGTDDVLEAEIDAFGTLLVVRGGYSGVDVTVAAERTPTPIDEERAWSFIEEAAARHGLAKDGGGGSLDDGVLHYGAVLAGQGVWHARLGVYTGRLWFLRESDD